MSTPPSTCNNITSATLYQLYQNLKKAPSIVKSLQNNYTGLALENNINAFNYLVGFSADSTEASFFINSTYSSANELNNYFNPSFMFKAWAIKSNIEALSELILSFEGVSGGNSVSLDSAATNDLYTFWNYYFDFIFYQFFCTQNGLKVQSTNPTIGSAYIDLKGTDNLLLQVKNLHSLLLTSQNGGDGLGSGGSGTKRLCEFCADFWSTNNDDNIRNTIVSNPGLNQFCGCCVGIPLLNFGSLGPQQPPIRCQPICSSPNVVKSYAGSSSVVNNGGDNSYQSTNSSFNSSVNGGFYLPYSCPNQTICIMDKLNIQVAGFNNQLDFNQVCPGCTNGECECFIDSGSNVIENMGADGSGMNNPVVFNQKCGKGTFCFNVQGDGTRVQVKCNTNNVANTSKHPDYGYDGSGKVSFLSSIAATNSYAYGIDNVIIPIIFFSVVVFYLLLTTIDIVSHIRRVYRIKNLIY